MGLETQLTIGFVILLHCLDPRLIRLDTTGSNLTLLLCKVLVATSSIPSAALPCERGLVKT